MRCQGWKNDGARGHLLQNGERKDTPPPTDAVTTWERGRLGMGIRSGPSILPVTCGVGVEGGGDTRRVLHSITPCTLPVTLGVGKGRTKGEFQSVNDLIQKRQNLIYSDKRGGGSGVRDRAVIHAEKCSGGLPRDGQGSIGGDGLLRLTPQWYSSSPRPPHNGPEAKAASQTANS
ncbi:hypothetical protein E2C01_080178 [Portunus trituberculatus]|uniref:Uncharacterized protein n=1 Tax=Portunus trituberculatus TaxID=210409 RepID=A0A5B7IUR0_PORTR|nr:hypothetical protein [Portunus trituberculatus]